MTENNGQMAALFEKLRLVMEDVRSLPKSARNDFHHYDYVPESAVKAAVHAALVEHRLVFVPGCTGVEYVEHGEKGALHARSSFTVTLVDTDTGAMWSFPWFGEGMDAQDKAFGKSVSLGFKYLWLTMLQIDTNEPDPDGSAGSRTGSASQAKQTRQGGVDPKTFTLRFGKHKGKTVAEIGDNPADAGYLKWALDNLDDDERNADLFAAIKAYLGMTTGGTEPEHEPPPEIESAPGTALTHWIDQTVNGVEARTAFWAWAKDTLKLTDEQVHAALGVEHVREYVGSMGDAKTAILNWNAARKEAEPFF